MQEKKSERTNKKKKLHNNKTKEKKNYNNSFRYSDRLIQSVMLFINIRLLN